MFGCCCNSCIALGNSVAGPPNSQLLLTVDKNTARGIRFGSCIQSRLYQILVHGSEWKMNLVRREFLPGDESGSICTVMYESVSIGDAASASGLCKVLATLLLLIDWAEKNYRPWFESVVSAFPSRQRGR